jgi:hypothetical protein
MLYNATTVTKTIKKSALKTSPPFPDTPLTHRMAFVKHILLKSATSLLPHVLKLLFATLKIEIEHTDEKFPGDGNGEMFAYWHGKKIAGWQL